MPDRPFNPFVCDFRIFCLVRNQAPTANYPRCVAWSQGEVGSQRHPEWEQYSNLLADPVLAVSGYDTDVQALLLKSFVCNVRTCAITTIYFHFFRRTTTSAGKSHMRRSRKLLIASNSVRDGLERLVSDAHRSATQLDRRHNARSAESPGPLRA